ncbi:MAG: protein kinase [Mastigocladus sp. ERB_26_2]
MSLCVNPHCLQQQNSDDELFCLYCGSELLLQGRYRVISQLRRGGFGLTYRVSEIRSNIPKVLKVLINNQSKAVELFKQEAEVLAKLNHPDIPKVERDDYFVYFPRNSQQPIHCLVMEKIVGMDLQQWMENREMRPIDQKLAIQWLRELVTILDQVHSQNFFHRDIKLSNIMLRADGDLALIDFGTVRQVTGTYQAKIASGQNITGIISAGYTPPEQINGRAEPRSDFFALGRTFVYLLTGQDPNQLYDPVNDELNWRRDAVGVSPTLADFIDRLMARLPGQPPANTQEILQNLANIERDLYPSPSPPPIPPQPIPPTSPVKPRRWTRRRFFKYLGFSSIGLAGAGLIYAIFPQRKSTLTVSKLGGGDYQTISEAIKNAYPGTRILVRPGLYQEGLIIDKPLEIIGEEGQKANIIIESTGSDCILMQTDRAVVSGLTLRGQAGQNKKEYFAVDIPQGQLLLVDCDITSDSLSCVAIHGSTANPVIRQCKIHDGKQGGVVVWKNAQGTVEDCDIYDNALAGVNIKEGGNPVIRQCKIHNSKQGGVLVYNNGQGTVEDCDIYGNALAGIEIRQGGNPAIRQCKIHDGKQNGVFVYNNAQGTVEDCDIFANAYSGVEIKDGGNPLIRQCRINQNKYNAVYVHDKGAGTVENCDLTGNGSSAFDIDSTSQVQRSGNKEDSPKS